MGLVQQMVVLRTGGLGVLGEALWSGAPFTIAPGSATKCHSENAALHVAFTAKEHNKWITDVKAESQSVRKWVPVPKQR